MGLKRHLFAKKTAALIALGALVVSRFFPGASINVFASERETELPVGGYLYIPREYEIPGLANAYINSPVPILRNTVIPNSYNSYASNKLPAIRDQGQEGACWAFAALGAIEADLIKDGNSGVDAVTGKPDIDLSELHMAYFTSHTVSDPKGLHSGDTYAYTGSGSYLSNGGNNQMAYRAMENLIGPIREDIMPYENGGSYVPDSSYAMGQNYVMLKGAYLINPHDKDDVKKAIMSHGAVATSFYAAGSLNNSYYSATYNSYYCYERLTPNHAIMLVGWDDNFPKEQFKKSPSADGAWLVRNSWGAEGYEYQGYFWLSYEDAGLLQYDPQNAVYKGEAVAYDADFDLFDNCYAYDGNPFPGGYVSVPSGMSMTQTYHVSGPEKISGVGFETASADLTAHITVSSGSESVSRIFSTDYAGYYFVPLGEDLVVADESDVVLKISFDSRNGEDVKVMIEIPANTSCGEIRYSSEVSGRFYIGSVSHASDPRFKLFSKNMDNIVHVTGISLDRSILNLTEGDDASLTATVAPDNASDKSVIFTSANTAVATVDGNGNVHAVGRGSTTITARTNDRSKTAVCTVNVAERVYEPEEIALNKLSLKVTKGYTASLYAAVLPEDVEDKSVVWSSSDPGVATVDQNGVVTGVDIGNAIITATSATKNTVFKCCDVEVVSEVINVSGVSIKNGDIEVTSLELEVGDSDSLTAVIVPENATIQDVTWESSNTSVITIDNSGRLSAVAPGNARITVKSAQDEEISASCDVRVLAKTIHTTGIVLDKNSLIMDPGDVVALSATVVPLNASNRNVVWTSDDLSVASVSSLGAVTAVYEGAAIVRAETVDGFYAECIVSVNKAGIPVESIVVDPVRKNMQIGETGRITAAVLPENAANKNISWSSNNTGIVTVDGEGNIRAVGAGTAVVTAMSQSGGITGSCTVTVERQKVPVSGVSLNSTMEKLTIGETFRLVANVYPASAYNKNVIWTSDDSSVATVDGSGNVRAAGYGNTFINVRTEDGNKTARCMIYVERPVDDSGKGWSEDGESSGGDDSGKAGGGTDSGNEKDGDEVSGAGGNSGTGDDSGAVEGTDTTDTNTGSGGNSEVTPITPDFGWYDRFNRSYWYENGVKQGTKDDPKGVSGDGTIRGREIYDPGTDAWYWLDACYDGAKAIGKEVWMPYVYQNEEGWEYDEIVGIAGNSDSGMQECVIDAIVNKRGKWVRYDENGKMIKGWVTIEGRLAQLYPEQKGNTYYYDTITGLMAKGWVTIEGNTYYFDEFSGVLVQ